MAFLGQVGIYLARAILLAGAAMVGILVGKTLSAKKKAKAK